MYGAVHEAGLSPPPSHTAAQPCTPTSTSPTCGAGWECAHRPTGEHIPIKSVFNKKLSRDSFVMCCGGHKLAGEGLSDVLWCARVPLALTQHTLDGNATRNTTRLLCSTRPGYTPISSPDSSGHTPVAHFPPPSPLLPPSPLPLARSLWLCCPGSLKAPLV